jgi:hypothetical protein
MSPAIFPLIVSCFINYVSFLAELLNEFKGTELIRGKLFYKRFGVRGVEYAVLLSWSPSVMRFWLSMEKLVTLLTDFQRFAHDER